MLAAANAHHVAVAARVQTPALSPPPPRADISSLSWSRLGDDRITVSWLDVVLDTEPADVVLHGQGFARRVSTLRYEQASLCGALIDGFEFHVLSGARPDVDTLDDVARDLHAEATDGTARHHDYLADVVSPTAETKAWVSAMAEAL